MSKYVDIIGKRFGRLEVLTDNVKIEEDRHEKYCICKCDCGTIKMIQRRSLIRNFTESCGCLRNQYNSILQIKEYTEFNAIFCEYRLQAKKRNLKFDLSKEEFKKLIESNCYYCGSEPSNTKIRNKNLLYSGIDRINNNEGYNIYNCVPCCKICNRAKTNLSYEEFINWINKIKKHDINNDIKMVNNK
jgi:hypothetical protein